MNRTEAIALLNEYTKNPSLIKHMLAVEAAMQAYARQLREDEMMLTAHIYDHAARLRSFELAADAFGEINEVRRGTEMPHSREVCVRTSTEQRP